MHKWLVYAYSSQDFVQTQENFARLNDRETVTFGNSGPWPITLTCNTNVLPNSYLVPV